MSTQRTQHRFWLKKGFWLTLGGGALLAVVVVLVSGVMVEATSSDRFCNTCHAMTPFRMAWQNSVHGGQNPQGFTAQCVDCHLPHDNFVDYLVTKARTGTSDVLHNLTIDAAVHDWAGQAARERRLFTYDNACRRCHHDLTSPPGISFGGLIAHRSYLLGKTGKHCVDCHPQVGHKDLFKTVDLYFHPQKLSDQ